MLYTLLYLKYSPQHYCELIHIQHENLTLFFLYILYILFSKFIYIWS